MGGWAWEERGGYQKKKMEPGRRGTIVGLAKKENSARLIHSPPLKAKYVHSFFHQFLSSFDQHLLGSCNAQEMRNQRALLGNQ